MDNLEKALEEILRQTFVARYTHPFIQKGKEPLYFPRNKLAVTKIRSGRWEPEAWFIKQRTKEKATRLELPTEISGEALTSGYRSCIVMDREGKYVKLKGVCLGALVGKPKEKGLGSYDQSIKELVNATMLNYQDFPGIAIRPRFAEIHFFPEKLSLEPFLEEYNLPRGGIHLREIDPGNRLQFNSEMNKYERFVENTVGKNPKVFSDDHYCVSAFEIEHDTRMDEATYYLTDKELAGQIKKERDNILHCISFRAGTTKAFLETQGYAWGKDLENTNNHIGNFVIGSTKSGFLDVAIVDVPDLAMKGMFKSKEEYHKHLEMELESLASDLRARTTMSMTAQKMYRHFPEELREECVNALKTGYSATLLHFRKHYGNIITVREPERVLVPENLMMTEEEFKHICKQIAE